MNGHVTPRTFRFFSELARHNERAWFEAHKQRYLDDVRDPLLRFIEAFEPRLARLRFRAPAGGGSEAPELHHEHALHREGCRRARLPRPVHRGVSARDAAHGVPDPRRRAPLVATGRYPGTIASWRREHASRRRS